MKKRFKLRKSILLSKIRTLPKTVVLEGVGLSLILGLFAMLWGTNVIRVVSNGKYNYETYLFEKKGLEQIAEKNEELKETREYVQSDEYKKLLARETLNMATDAENIYRTSQKPVYYEEEKQYLDVTVKTDFRDWWEKLLDGCIN